MGDTRQHEVTTPDGRRLAVLDTGVPDGPALVAHHGTPSAGRVYRPEVESAEQQGARLIAYDRPGYGGSTPHPGRSIADAVADVAAILDALGIERFATYGWSGGGPHALACAALLPERCLAAATIAGVAPYDAPDLDWMADMGEGNVIEFGAALEGREPLSELCRAEAVAIMAAGPEQLADAMRPHLSDVDRAALTGEFAEFLAGSLHDGLRPGIDGWVDDDLAFASPWGFELDAITVPLRVWQGAHDLMVPPEHGRWLRSHLPGAEGGIVEEDGHLTLFADRIGDIHAWLLSQATRTRPA
jgi:pimeloyl-ACP methyl ester carboxylesterase